jgi:hypothetical protein
MKKEMKNRDARAKLESLITLVEARKKMELLELKGSVNGLVDNLKPANLLSSTFDEFAKPEIKEKLVASVLSLVAGYLSCKLIVGKSNHPVRKMAGYLIQWAVSKLLARKL